MPTSMVSRGCLVYGYRPHCQIALFCVERWFVSGSVHHAGVQGLGALEVYVGVCAKRGLHTRVHGPFFAAHAHACTYNYIC